MENNKCNIQYISLADGTSPIPQYIEKCSREGYVKWGSDNLYGEYLVKLRNESGKHNAILKTKSQLIAGNGFDLSNIDGPAAQFIANPYNELTLDEIAFRTAADVELFGAAALEILYSKDRTKIAEVNFLPVNKIRIGDDWEHFYFCQDWSNTRKYNPIKYPKFDPRRSNQPKQIFYFKEYRPGCEYYGQPEYLSGVNWIAMEWEISKFHLNQIKRGFAPSMIIQFPNGIPSEDEMRNVIAQLKRDYQGAQGETVMFQFAEDSSRLPVVIPIQLNDSDKKYIELNKEITEGILTAHQTTSPELFGVFKEGLQIGATPFKESLDIFQAMYVNPKQFWIEKQFNKLLRFNGSKTPLRLNKYNLTQSEEIDKKEE